MKSMQLFFIDNQHLMEEGAELHGNLVVAKLEPRQKFPTSNFVPMGMATVDGFDGMLFLQAGNGALVITIIEGKTKDDLRDINKILVTQKPSQWPDYIHQYRINMLGIMQYMALLHSGEDPHNDVSTGELLAQVARNSRNSKDQEANFVVDLIKANLGSVSSPEQFELFDQLVEIRDVQ